MWFALFIFFTRLIFIQGNEWVVVVAGSQGWDNYRHQADCAHAYHLAHIHGIPDERVIMMQYDDIAHNVDNPFLGEIFNAPSAVNESGADFYKGILKDYTGENVTVANFLAVLTGDKEISQGKVLDSN